MITTTTTMKRKRRIMNHPPFSNSLLLLMFLMARWGNDVSSFTIISKPNHPPSSRERTSSTTTKIYMSSVFDFLKERSKEGLDQLNKLSTAAQKGELQQAIQDVAQYTQKTNQAFADGLAKSRNQLLGQIETILTGVSPDQVLEDLQDILIQSDLGSKTAEDIVLEIKSLRSDSTKMLSKDDLKSILRGKLLEAFDSTTVATTASNDNQMETLQFSDRPDVLPTVFFIIGANGMGKTTSIGKLAYKLQNDYNMTVLMAACDTFRAGAVEQLQQWATRVDCDIVTPDENAKTPAAVLYKALDVAMKPKTIITPMISDANGSDDDDATEGTTPATTTITKPYSYDVILVDTSGRLSNNEALTAELVKMKKVIQKRLSIENDDVENKPIPNANVPQETLLVLDASQGGRMALQSAQIWNTEIGLTGLVLTKLDGTARGGSVVAISRDLHVPVKLIGVGEKITDLQNFDRERFVDGLLGIGAAGGSTSKSSSGGINSDEAKQLAQRLQEMRKERDERAKVVAVEKLQQKKSSAAMKSIPSIGTTTATSSSSSPVIDGVVSLTSNTSSGSNKNKKKRKKTKK